MKKKRLSNRERRILHFRRYMNETFKNKLYAVLMVILAGGVTYLDGDATALVLILMMAIPLFFATKKVVY